MIAILMASAIAIVLSISFTRALMWFFARLGKGQPILGAEDRGPTHHMHKQGTPTMASHMNKAWSENTKPSRA